jgi:hypothetical protein
VRSVQEQCAGDAIRRGDSAGSYAGVPAVFQWHTCVSGRSLAREQENPELRKGDSLANQSGSIASSQRSTTSSSSYSSPIVRVKPRHLEEAREPSYRASSDSFARTSSPWQSRLSSPRITMRNTSLVILHPLQFSTNFFITHGISSPSSSSHCQSCSPQEIHFHPFFSTTKATPRFALIH